MSEEIKCCANCTWLGEFPKSNRYNDIDLVCLKTGMSMSRKDTTKDLNKYEWSTSWSKKHCNFKSKAEGIKL